MLFNMGFMVEKVTLREVCLRVLWFCPQSPPFHHISMLFMVEKVTLREVCLRILWFCPQSPPFHRISMLFLSVITDAIQSWLVSVSLTHLKLLKYIVSVLSQIYLCFCLYSWHIFALFCCMFSNIKPPITLQCERVI